MVELVKHVFNKRWEVLTSDAKMGVQSTMEGLFAILCQAVVDYSTEKQAKLAAAMNPAIHEVCSLVCIVLNGRIHGGCQLCLFFR